MVRSGSGGLSDRDRVIQQIHEAFGDNEYPGDPWLMGSFQGCEPYEVIAPFEQMKDWRAVDAAMLDTNYTALSSFSKAGLRFFLPAYLIADLRGELQTADPLFIVAHGFSDMAIEHRTKAGVFERRTGRTVFINPRRYGAMTFYDYACYRLSIFTREEAAAIVAYLQYKRETDEYGLHAAEIDAALDLFWLHRAQNAPTAEQLRQHVLAEDAYLSAISAETDDGGPA